MTIYFHSSQKGEIRDRIEKLFLNLNIFYCLNNDKRIRHKFFNLVLSSPLFLATGLQRKSANKQKCCSLGASASYLLRCKVLLQSPIASTRYLYTSRPNVVLLFLPLAQPVDVQVKWIVHPNRKNMSDESQTGNKPFLSKFRTV